jgi:hypothetical protein
MAFSAKILPISSMRPGDSTPEFSNDSITQPSHKIHRENVTSSLFVAGARPNAKIRVAPPNFICFLVLSAAHLIGAEFACNHLTEN